MVDPLLMISLKPWGRFFCGYTCKVQSDEGNRCASTLVFCPCCATWTRLKATVRIGVVWEGPPPPPPPSRQTNRALRAQKATLAGGGKEGEGSNLWSHLQWESRQTEHPNAKQRCTAKYTQRLGLYLKLPLTLSIGSCYFCYSNFGVVDIVLRVGVGGGVDYISPVSFFNNLFQNECVYPCWCYVVWSLGKWGY